jgi:hypothetical protein
MVKTGEAPRSWRTTAAGIRRTGGAGRWGNWLGASWRRVVPDFWVRSGSPHRSRAAHGVGGQADKLDGDNVAHRSMAAVDEP